MQTLMPWRAGQIPDCRVKKVLGTVGDEWMMLLRASSGSFDWTTADDAPLLGARPLKVNKGLMAALWSR